MKRQKLSQDVVPVSVSSNETTKTFTVPRLARNSMTGLVDALSFFKLYDTYQLVHIINTSREEVEGRFDEKQEEEEQFGASHVAELFQNLNPMDRNSWNWENAPQQQQDMNPISFLKQDWAAVDENPSSNHMSRRRGYASFLVQHDPEQQDALLHRLPMTDLPLTQYQTLKRQFTFGSCIWFFFGRNDDGGHLPGRPRHTDAVGQDGTFHYQLSGCKIWFLQPTEELCNKSLSEDDHPIDPQMTLEVICNKGDVLVINTRLWWHSTVLPVQPRMDKKKKNSDKESVPSISYARDFYLGTGHDTKADEEKDASQVGLEQQRQQQPMSNVDGLYATTLIESGTILFTERDMPDCELHRSKDNPNCELVELEDGCMAIISCRDIQAGEFFCVEESDDDDDDDEEEEEEDDDASEECDDRDSD